MKPANLLFILSDEHQRAALGCYGHPVVRTPNLDRLAARGARFTRAYTPCPICVPARASLATGRHVHQIGCWDNAHPYDGSVPSWHHRLREQGFPVAVIGKLHFRSARDDNGFSEEIDPLHVVDGVGDLLGSIRDNPPKRAHARKVVVEAGPGDSTYLQYDARIAIQAARWIGQHANDARPWRLFVSFVCPHPPYKAPPELFEYYAKQDFALPAQALPGEWPSHPALRLARETFDHGGFDEAETRKVMAAYFGACERLDARIGEVIGALDSQGLMDKTRILYTSDHGDSIGGRGLFGKFTMYEESAGVPLILAGPGVPAGKVVETPVSLIDCFPTVLEAVGAKPAPEDASLPGKSLWGIARADQVEDRTAFSEYHAVGSSSAFYMLRDRRWKYVYYVGGPPQLFDLENDPDELNDLGEAPGRQDVVRAFEKKLRAMMDPEAVDARAKADQKARLAAFGGEEAVRRRGTFGVSPVPGEKPNFISAEKR